MVNVQSKMSRRNVLRGVLGGSAITVALPFLECFLNGNGTALASGAPIPVRFGTWFWGLGMDEGAFIPRKAGVDYELPQQIQSWAPIKQHINLFTKFDVPLDGKANLCHYTGMIALRTGIVPASRTVYPGQSIDVNISDAIGLTSRFKAIDCAASGSARDSYSFRSADAINPPSVSALELYQKVFGSEFQDPNATSEFVPNPEIMVRKSVLSAVREQASTIKGYVSASDRARLDEYFTSIRQIETRLAGMMEKPSAAPSCKVASAPNVKMQSQSVDVEVMAVQNKMMSEIMAMAVACNQTRVFNLVYSNVRANTIRKGIENTHHTVTHEEPTDKNLGYQPMSFWFVQRAMESFADFVQAFASIPEGDGTLLDNCLIYAHSDQNFAKIHSVSGTPMMTAGKAGGRMKTGLHIDGKGELATRVGYTVQRLMGLNVNEWGGLSLKTSREISEIIA